MSTPSNDLRSLIEGADKGEEGATKTGTPPKEDVKKAEGESISDDKKGERGEELDLTDVETDDEEDDELTDDEGEVEEKEVVSAPKEPSTLTKLKKEPGVKDILKKYPEVEDNFYEARRYKQVFATVDEAKLASNKSETFDEIVGHLMNGNIGHLFDELHNVDPSVVPILVNNFLPTVHRASKEMFNSVVTPLMSNMLARVAKDAQKSGNEDLLLAVRYVNRHISGDSGIPSFTKIESLSRRSEDASKVEGEKQAEAENLFYESVEEIMMPRLDAEINNGLDPDNVLTSAMRKTLVRSVKRNILLRLGKNSEHMHTMTALKKAARSSNYSKEYRRKIARVSLNAALELVPSIRAKTKKKMFGNMFTAAGNGSGEGKPQRDPGGSGGNPNTVGSGSGTASQFDPQKIDWSRTDLREAMDGKVTLRK